MNLETEVKYQVQTKGITLDEWYNFYPPSTDLGSIREMLALAKKKTGCDCRIVKLTTTMEVIE